MEVYNGLLFFFVVGTIIGGSFLAWTYTKPGKKWLKELDKLSMALEQVPHERQGDRSAISQKMDQIKEVLHVGKERH